MGGKSQEPLFGPKNALSLAGALAISLAAVFLLSEFDSLRGLGYPGVFLISLISSATVFLPMPGFAIVFAMAAYLDPLLLGIAAGLGSGLGEISGYLVGFAGHDALMRTSLFREHKKQIRKYGPFAIFFLSLLPNPAFDVAGVASGAVKMPLWQFLAATVAGKILRYVLLAYFGAAAAAWI